MENNSQPITNPDPQTPAAPASNSSPSIKSFLSSKILLLVIAVLILIFAGGGIYLALNSKPSQKACTQEAKICPDGTSVGRSGPKCEFSPCPNKPTPTPDPTASWKTYSSKYYSIKLPESWSKVTEQIAPDQSSWNFQNIHVQENSEKSWLTIESKSASLLDLDTYLHELLKVQKQEQLILANVSMTKLTGIDKVNSQLGEDQRVVIYFYQGNKIYIIIYTTTRKSLDELDQILSTFKFTDSGLSPTPTCKPRPACLDATPRCLIPETSDMCPPTVTPQIKAGKS